MDKKISVIIVDDHPLVLSGFEYILEVASEIELKGKFTRAKEALEFLVDRPVDVVLMDINMPEMNGIEATAKILKNCANTRVIAISNLDEGSIARRMLDAGASGYLLKNVGAEELLASIKSVERGAIAVSKEMDYITGEKFDATPTVTEREKEVLGYMAKGHTTPQIAELMFISPLTVESHRRNLLQKFKVTNSASLIHRATEMKYI